MGVSADNGQPGAADDTVELVYLTNHTGGVGRQFAAVAIDRDHEASFTYAEQSSAPALGILLDEPADGGVGKVAIRGTTSSGVSALPIRPGESPRPLGDVRGACRRPEPL
jgi:hypothetical protein